ncbi:hypothetical protein SNEBB_009188 [Seison nebaliae]|nr:hypothetical protein SNEBB_009188 [Seison nebaliae]
MSVQTYDSHSVKIVVKFEPNEQLDDRYFVSVRRTPKLFYAQHIHHYRQLDTNAAKILYAKKQQLRCHRLVEMHRRLADSPFILSLSNTVELGPSTICLFQLPVYGDLNYLRKQRVFTERTVRIWSIQILAGIDYMRTQRIVHRNLTPHSIFVTFNGNICIGGLTEAIYLRNGYAKTAYFPNGYIAPEICEVACYKGQRKSSSNNVYTYNSDIFSYGALLCYLTMRHGAYRIERFSLENIEQSIRRRIGKLIESPHVSNQFVQLVKECLTVDPKRRPNSDELLRNESLFSSEAIAKSLQGHNLDMRLSISWLNEIKHATYLEDVHDFNHFHPSYIEALKNRLDVIRLSNH